MVMKKKFIVGLCSSFVLMGGLLFSTDAKAEVPTENPDPLIPLDEWNATFKLDNSFEQYEIIEHNGVEVGVIGLSRYPSYFDGFGVYRINALSNLVVGPYSNDDNNYDYDFQEMGFALYVDHRNPGNSKIYGPNEALHPWKFEEFLTMPHGFGQGWLLDTVAVTQTAETESDPAKAIFHAQISEGWEYEEFLANLKLEVETENDEMHVKFTYENLR